MACLLHQQTYHLYRFHFLLFLLSLSLLFTKSPCYSSHLLIFAPFIKIRQNSTSVSSPPPLFTNLSRVLFSFSLFFSFSLILLHFRNLGSGGVVWIKSNRVTPSADGTGNRAGGVGECNGFKSHNGWLYLLVCCLWRRAGTNTLVACLLFSLLPQGNFYLASFDFAEFQLSERGTAR